MERQVYLMAMPTRFKEITVVLILKILKANSEYPRKVEEWSLH